MADADKSLDILIKFGLSDEAAKEALEHLNKLKEHTEENAHATDKLHISHGNLHKMLRMLGRSLGEFGHLIHYAFNPWLLATASVGFAIHHVVELNEKLKKSIEEAAAIGTAAWMAQQTAIEDSTKAQEEFMRSVNATATVEEETLKRFTNQRDILKQIVALQAEAAGKPAPIGTAGDAVQAALLERQRKERMANVAPLVEAERQAVSAAIDERTDPVAARARDEKKALEEKQRELDKKAEIQRAAINEGMRVNPGFSRASIIEVMAQSPGYHDDIAAAEENKQKVAALSKTIEHFDSTLAQAEADLAAARKATTDNKAAITALTTEIDKYKETVAAALASKEESIAGAIAGRIARGEKVSPDEAQFVQNAGGQLRGHTVTLAQAVTDLQAGANNAQAFLLQAARLATVMQGFDPKGIADLQSRIDILEGRAKNGTRTQGN